jgi:hypothetical protein
MSDLRTWPGPQRPAWDNGMAATDRPVPETHIALAARGSDEDRSAGVRVELIFLTGDGL